MVYRARKTAVRYTFCRLIDTLYYTVILHVLTEIGGRSPTLRSFVALFVCRRCCAEKSE